MDETKWRDHFKILKTRKNENCPFLPWYSVNGHKRHVKLAYIQAETHSSTAIENE